MGFALGFAPFLTILALAPGLEPMLVIGPDSNGFSEVRQVLMFELNEDFEFTSMNLDEGLVDLHELEMRLEEVNPKLVVLMNNGAIELYKEYQQAVGADKLPPAISCMALFIEEATRNMPNTVALGYDIPAVTSLVNLRDLISLPIQRVGVVYRSGFQAFINRQQLYCTQEKIQLIPYPVGDDKLDKHIKKGLQFLIKHEKVDAIWVPNDNVMLTQRLLIKAWLPGLRRFKKPVVVGVPTLLHNRFGNFAVLPDHGGLGKQIAGLALEIMGNNWQIDDNLLREPLTVSKHLKLDFARKHLNLKEDKIQEVDFLLKE